MNMELMCKRSINNPFAGAEQFVSHPSSLIRHLLSLFLLLFTASCNDSQFEFSTYKAFFIFDNSTHLEPALSTAMNPLTPGIFCHITMSSGNSFSFTNNQGQSGRQTASALELKRTILLGIYNESGVFVGYGMLTDPVQFFAYDAQCPNCYKESNLPRYPLSMTSDGHAKCSRCNRTYDMNNYGIISDGEAGDKLIRYRAQTTGPNGVLSINN